MCGRGRCVVHPLLCRRWGNIHRLRPKTRHVTSHKWKTGLCARCCVLGATRWKSRALKCPFGLAICGEVAQRGSRRRRRGRRWRWRGRRRRVRRRRRRRRRWRRRRWVDAKVDVAAGQADALAGIAATAARARPAVAAVELAAATVARASGRAAAHVGVAALARLRAAELEAGLRERGREY